jgi:hypothetical protein
LVYDQSGRLIGNRFSYFLNDVASSKSSIEYRYEGNLVIESYNGIESRTATLGPDTKYLISRNHLRNFRVSPNDSIFWADEAFAYDANGFQKKQRVDVKVVNRSNDLRVVLTESREDTMINDSKNIIKKISIVSKSDSAFSTTNGSFIKANRSRSRYIHTYTYSSDSMLAFRNLPYPVGRNNSNMMASETYTVESSTDGGITWSLLSTYSTLFTHEISNRLLQRSLVKEVGNRDVVYTYFYGKR